MRGQSVACRLTALFLSVVLLCGAFPLPAAASETENDGMPSGGVVEWIQTTIRGVPSDSQLEWLRADALEKAPEGCVFYGWVITGEQGSLTIPDGELESRLHDTYDDLPEEEILQLVLQYLYIPGEKAPAEPAPEQTEPLTTGAQEPTEADVPDSGFPQYFQGDYPDTMYGSGTIASSGCGIVSLAMVATYMTGHTYLPDTLARYFGGKAANNIDRLEYGSNAMQLPYKKAENWHETYRALKEGKVAIALMGPNSIFTDSQHFIVLTGINEAGKIMVNDPERDNYSHWRLKNAFVSGFEESDIIAGYSGAWIYDKGAMPEEPFVYYVAEPVRGDPRYDFELTQEEIELLACLVWAEAQGESADGQQAVAEVALNRLASDRFPNNLHDVIYGEGQFRSASQLDKAEPFQAQYEAIENAIYGPYILPEDVYYFGTTPRNNNVWGNIGGHVFCYAPK